MQLDAAPLETALLQNVARRRVGDPRACSELLDIEFLKSEIDRRARGFSAKPLAPMRDPEPIAELRRVRLAPVDSDYADRRTIGFNQEHGVAAVARGCAHEFDRMVLGVGMRQATGIYCDPAIVGEARNRFYV